MITKYEEKAFKIKIYYLYFNTEGQETVKCSKILFGNDTIELAKENIKRISDVQQYTTCLREAKHISNIVVPPTPDFTEYWEYDKSIQKVFLKEDDGTEYIWQCYDYFALGADCILTNIEIVVYSQKL